MLRAYRRPLLPLLLQTTRAHRIQRHASSTATAAATAAVVPPATGGSSSGRSSPLKTVAKLVAASAVAATGYVTYEVLRTEYERLPVTEHGFGWQAPPKDLVVTQSHEELLRLLKDATRPSGPIVLMGPAGVGKSAAATWAVEEQAAHWVQHGYLPRKHIGERPWLSIHVNPASGDNVELLLYRALLKCHIINNDGSGVIEPANLTWDGLTSMLNSPTGVQELLGTVVHMSPLLQSLGLGGKSQLLPPSAAHGVALETRDHAVKQALAKFKTSLESESGWTIVLDNVDAAFMARAQPYLPQKGGTVIVTTSDPALAAATPAGCVVQIKPFELAHAVTFLKRRGVDLEPAQVKQLTDQIGFAPIALQQAVVMLGRISFDKYMDSLHRLSLTSNNGTLKAVAASMQQLRASATQKCLFGLREPKSAEEAILFIMSGFVAHAVPRQWVQEIFETAVAKEPTPPGCTFEEAVASLQAHGLVTSETKAGQRYLSIHSCVHHATRHMMLKPLATVPSWLSRSGLSWHLTSAGIHGSIIDVQLQTMTNKLKEMKDGGYATVAPNLAYLHEAFLLHSQHPTVPHVHSKYYSADNAIAHLMQLGDTQFVMSSEMSVQRAMFSWEKARRLCTSTAHHLLDQAELEFRIAAGKYALGTEDTEYTMNRMLSDVVKAANLLYRVSSENTDMGIIMQQLAAAFKDMGGEETIRTHAAVIESALNIRHEVLGAKHSEAAAALHNLSSVYFHLGGENNLRKAIQLAEEAVAIQREITEPRHAMVAKYLTHLSVLHGEIGTDASLRAAIPFIEEALSIQREKLGANHPEVVTSLQVLAQEYELLGSEPNVRKQIGFLEDALRILKAQPEENSTPISKTLVKLGQAHGKLPGDAEARKAIQYMEEALTLVRDTLGPKHQYTATVLVKAGAAYGRLGDPESIRHQIVLLEDALSIQRASAVPRPCVTAATLRDLAAAHGALGDKLKQVQLGEEALEMSMTYCGVGPHHKGARRKARVSELKQHLSQLTAAYQLLGGDDSMRRLAELQVELDALNE